MRRQVEGSILVSSRDRTVKRTLQEVVVIVILAASLATGLRLEALQQIFDSRVPEQDRRKKVYDAVLVRMRDGRNGSGACVILNNRVYVVTAKHIVKDVEEGTISIGRRSYRICNVRSHPHLDLAVLSCHWGRQGYLGRIFEVADMDPRPGDVLRISGWASGTRHLSSDGICSARRFDGRLAVLGTRVFPGQSGGPIADRDGKLVSVVWGVSGNEVVAVSPSKFREWLQSLQFGSNRSRSLKEPR